MAFRTDPNPTSRTTTSGLEHSNQVLTGRNPTASPPPLCRPHACARRRCRTPTSSRCRRASCRSSWRAAAVAATSHGRSSPAALTFYVLYIIYYILYIIHPEEHIVAQKGRKAEDFPRSPSYQLCGHQCDCVRMLSLVDTKTNSLIVRRS